MSERIGNVDVDGWKFSVQMELEKAIACLEQEAYKDAVGFLKKTVLLARILPGEKTLGWAKDRIFDALQEAFKEES